MRGGRTAVSLTGLFLFFLVIQLIACATSLAQGAIRPQELTMLYLKILAVYSVPLGVILGGVFARREHRQPSDSGTAFLIAMGLAIVWNLILVGRLFAFVWADTDSTASLIDYYDNVAKAGSFLIAGALAYFFAK